MDYACVEEVINKTFEKEARSYYQHKSLSMDCPEGPKNQLVETVCVKKKCQIKKPEWFQCEKDLDCVHLKYDCAEAVVNKRFETEARKFYEHRAQVLNCITPVKTGNEPRVKVVCKNKKCAQETEKK